MFCLTASIHVKPTQQPQFDTCLGASYINDDPFRLMTPQHTQELNPRAQ